MNFDISAAASSLVVCDARIRQLIEMIHEYFSHNCYDAFSSSKASLAHSLATDDRNVKNAFIASSMCASKYINALMWISRGVSSTHNINNIFSRLRQHASCTRQRTNETNMQIDFKAQFVSIISFR
jgi:hypothetical protein